MKAVNAWSAHPIFKYQLEKNQMVVQVSQGEFEQD